MVRSAGRGSIMTFERAWPTAVLAVSLILEACGGGASTPPSVPSATPAGTLAPASPTATPPSTAGPSDTAGPAHSDMPAGALGQFAFIRPVTSTGVDPDIWLATVWPGSGPARFTITTVPLTNHPGVELGLSWSPDGSRLAFIRRDETTRSLWSMRADGSGQVQLAVDADDGSAPSWSPDGTRLVFQVETDNGRGIAVVGADGTRLDQLTDDGLSDAPTWSPTGELIAFRRASSHGLDDPGTSSVWLMGADGSGQRALSSGVGAVTTSLAWSPDGLQIAFGRDGSPSQTGATGTSIRIMRLDGLEEIALTDGSAQDHDPVWAPAGNELLFVRTIDVGPEESTADLWLVNADGSGARRLLDSDTTDFGATWSSDGGVIACMAESGPAGGGIAILAADGTGMTIVDADASLPAWRPGS